mgnify:FL=1
MKLITHYDSSVTIIQSSTSLGLPYATDLISITADNNSSLKWIYDGCDDTKVCIGVPAGCVDSKNCNLFGAVIFENNTFIFELLSMRKIYSIILFMQFLINS